METLILRPSEIRYSQDSIGCRFSDGTPLTCVFAHLISGSLKVTDLPRIEVLSMNGHWWTLTGNRRLVLYRKLEEVGVVEMISVTKSWISSTSDLFRKKFTNVCNGKKVSCGQKFLQPSLNQIVSEWRRGQDVVAKWDKFKQALAVHYGCQDNEDSEECQSYCDYDQSEYGLYDYDEDDDYCGEQNDCDDPEGQDDYYQDADGDQYQDGHYDEYDNADTYNDNIDEYDDYDHINAHYDQIGAHDVPIYALNDRIDECTDHINACNYNIHAYDDHTDAYYDQIDAYYDQIDAQNDHLYAYYDLDEYNDQMKAYFDHLDACDDDVDWYCTDPDTGKFILLYPRTYIAFIPDNQLRRTFNLTSWITDDYDDYDDYRRHHEDYDDDYRRHYEDYDDDYRRHYEDYDDDYRRHYEDDDEYYY